MKIKHTKSSEETRYLGHQVGLLLKAGMVVLLDGDLAAGKTTFTKGVGLALGFKETINSPTFTILKRYIQGEVKLYHVDLYRLSSELEDFDLEDYITSDGISIIEWPFNVKSILPKEHLLVQFRIDSEHERTIKFIARGKDYERIVSYL